MIYDCLHFNFAAGMMHSSTMSQLYKKFSAAEGEYFYTFTLLHLSFNNNLFFFFFFCGSFISDFFLYFVGVIFPDQVPSFSGSTDMGNVSLVVPSIHPGFFIGEPFMIHTRDFQRLAGSPEAQKYTLIAAKAMALTAVELLAKKEVRDQAKTEFEQKKKLFAG